MRLRSCVFVSFSSSFAPFLCLQKKQKNSHQNAVALDFNDRTRNKFLPDRETKRVKKEERFSHEREREKRRETRAFCRTTRQKKNWYIELSSTSSSSSSS